MNETDVREATRPPSPDGIPVLGNGLAFARDPFGALERWANLGELVRIDIPGERLYLVTDPSYVEAILHDPQDCFTISDRQQEAFAGLEDHAVSTNRGDRWKRLRRALHPAFTRNAITRYGEGMVEQTAARIDSWEEGEQFDLQREMQLLTRNILGETLLNVDVRGNERVVTNAADALVARGDPRRPGQFLPNWVPTPTQRRFRRAVHELDAFVDRCLADHPMTEGETSDPNGRSDPDEQAHESGAPPTRQGHERTDAASVLIAAHERGELTVEEVRHNVVALLLAGTDTSSLGLTYCWYLLSEHPDVRERLVDEYETHVGPGLPTVEARSKLQYAQNVVSETLRLYPPTWGFMRQTTAPVVLGEYRLPAGAPLMLSPWVLHRDERFWDDPERFDPSRWDGETERPEYAYFPFGGGPRHCIGMHFARLELVLALATMIGRVELDVSADGPLTFVPTLALRPETELTATVHHR